jgi:hypothetical protein
MQRDLSKLPDHCGIAIRGIGADDVGYVDFAKLAFYLSGFTFVPSTIFSF